VTYAKLKSAIQLLLIGDNELPGDNEQVLAAIEMAYIQMASQVTALKLLTSNNSSEVIRQGPGGTYVRMPKLPTSDTDELDIDRELCPALARIVASYISRDKGGIHNTEAQKVMKSYESKVRVFLEEQESEGAYSDSIVYPDTHASIRVKGY
jgi:hypothetical protein